MSEPHACTCAGCAYERALEALTRPSVLQTLAMAQGIALGVRRILEGRGEDMAEVSLVDEELRVLREALRQIGDNLRGDQRRGTGSLSDPTQGRQEG